jgi:CRP-like cAMP-binding protein
MSPAANPVALPSLASLPGLWPPMQACAKETSARLIAASEAVQYRANEPILEIGEAPDRVVVVSEGVVRIFHVKEPGVEFTVKLLRGPAAVGLVEVVTGHTWAASVEALVPSAGIVVPNWALRAELERDPQLARAILGDLSTLFEGTIRANHHLGFDDCETRLLRLLLEYADHFGRPSPEGLVIRFALSLERLAREVGVNRRSIDRAMAALHKARLVERTPKGWLLLRDREAARTRVGR